MTNLAIILTNFSYCIIQTYTIVVGGNFHIIEESTICPIRVTYSLSLTILPWSRCSFYRNNVEYFVSNNVGDVLSVCVESCSEQQALHYRIMMGNTLKVMLLLSSVLLTQPPQGHTRPASPEQGVKRKVENCFTHLPYFTKYAQYAWVRLFLQFRIKAIHNRTVLRNGCFKI